LNKGLFNLKSNRNGNLAMYSIIFILFGLLVAIFVFFPQFVTTRTGIYSISCKDIKRKISIAIEDHEANQTNSIIKPGGKVDLDALKVRGYLDDIKLCPEKGVFMFTKDGKVMCTVHDEGVAND
jgi:hypothetical protein